MNDHNEPLVSIGLMTFNRAHYLPGIIDSWLTQTYKNFELIISDDVSSDGTQAICEAYAKKDSRIRYIRQPVNLNQPLCFKVILQEAKGEFFIWATDDDLWDPRLLEDSLKVYREHPELVMVFPDMVDIDKDGKPFKHLDPVGYMPTGRNTYERLRKQMLNYFTDGKNQLILGLWRREAILDDPLFGPKPKNDLPHYYWGFENYFTVRAVSKGPFGIVPETRFFRRSRVLDEYRPPRSFVPRLATTFYRRTEKIFGTPYFWYVFGLVASMPQISAWEKTKLFGWNIFVMARLFVARKI